MTNSFFDASEIAELIFALVLLIVGLGMAVVRATRVERHRRRALAACRHRAWRALSLRVKGTGQALKISCFRCGAPALDRFKATACSDGAISITNMTGQTQILVINGVLHEIYPFEADPADVDGELLVFVDHVDLRKV